MGYIKQLSDELIKKIAAGEVIERPASVVKELLENSIDAGATKIEIGIERAGKYVKVSDNGMGIDPGDIDLLFTRHATSKIKYFDDLWNIKTLGFRGEALSSVSSVSKITCRSKHINQEYGFEIKVTEGNITKKTSAISIGTVFEIDDLFYNVPARQKFLKSATTEIGHISELISSLALSHPKVSFTLLNNKSILLKAGGSGNLENTIVELLGSDLKDKLIPISGKNEFLELSGFVSALEVFRSDKKSVFIFVNNRPVKCQIVSKAIYSVYEGLLPPSKYPVVVLNLSFKSKFVDVNVHPTKKEVRYTQPNDTYNLVLHMIQNTVSEYYKKEYKEKAVYSVKKQQAEQKSPIAILSPVELQRHCEEQSDEAILLRNEIASSALAEPPRSPRFAGEAGNDVFSVNHLKCEIIHSSKPIANMTKIGNKTIFEVGTIFDKNVQVVYSGEIIGDEEYKKRFFNFLSDLSSEIDKAYSNKTPAIQKKLINPDLEDENHKESRRKKPPEKTLYSVWERDNWTCVYCEKHLLDPKLVKDLTEKRMEITVDALREHLASYDHYLPVSKLPQFNFDPENLYACCIKCNKEKLDSMELNTWKPKRQNSWGKPLVIGKMIINSPCLNAKIASNIS